jgi:hypothetical protein
MRSLDTSVYVSLLEPHHTQLLLAREAGRLDIWLGRLLIEEGEEESDYEWCWITTLVIYHTSK